VASQREAEANLAKAYEERAYGKSADAYANLKSIGEAKKLFQKGDIQEAADIFNLRIGKPSPAEKADTAVDEATNLTAPLVDRVAQDVDEAVNLAFNAANDVNATGQNPATSAVLAQLGQNLADQGASNVDNATKAAATLVANAANDAAANAAPKANVPPPPSPVITPASTVEDLQEQLSVRQNARRTLDFGDQGNAQIDNDIQTLTQEIQTRSAKPPVVTAPPAAEATTLPPAEAPPTTPAVLSEEEKINLIANDLIPLKEYSSKEDLEKGARSMEALIGLPPDTLTPVRSNVSKVFRQDDGIFVKLAMAASDKEFSKIQRQLDLLAGYNNLAELPKLSVIMQPEGGGAIYVMRQMPVGIEGVQVHKNKNFTKKDQALFDELQAQNPLSTNANPNAVLRVETDSALKNMGLVVGDDGMVRAIAFDFDGVAEEDILQHGEEARRILEQQGTTPMKGVPLSNFSPPIQKAILDGQVAPAPIAAPPPPPPSPLTGQPTALPVGTATPQPTPTNAPVQRNIPENGKQERVQTDEGGPTAETGGRNRPVSGRQVQAQVQEADVTAPTPAVGAIPAAEVAKAPKGKKVSKEAQAAQFLKHPMIVAILRFGKLMSKSKAKSLGGTLWEKNKAEWGDAPQLSPAFNKIYSSSMGNLPDKVAGALANDGFGDGTVRTMWQMIGEIAQSAANQGKQVAKQEANLREGEQTRLEFEKALEKGPVEIDPTTLNFGNTVTIDGDPMRVSFIPDENGDPAFLILTGSKFGEQQLDPNTPFRADEKPDKSNEPPPGEFFAIPESRRPAVRGETKRPQATDPLAELAAATRAGEAKRAQQKLDLEPATQPEAESDWAKTRRNLTSPEAIAEWDKAKDVTNQEELGQIRDKAIELEMAARQPAPAAKVEEAPAAKVEKAAAPKKKKAKEAPAAKVEEAPVTMAEAPPAAKVEEAPTPRQKRKQETASKIASIRQAAKKDIDALLAEMSKRTTTGGSPDIAIQILTRIGQAAVKEGVVRFSDFAAAMKEMVPQVWQQIRGMLATAWDTLRAFYPQIESLPEPAEVESILSRLDPPASKDLDTPLGFGQNRRKSINQLIESDPLYLFNSLFNEELTKGISNRARLEEVRNIVRRLPQYAEWQEASNLTAEQLAEINAPFADQVQQTIQELSSLGINARVDNNGFISIDGSQKTTPYENQLARNGFYFNPSTGQFSVTEHRNFVQLGRDIRSANRGEERGVGARRNYVSAERRAAINAKRDGINVMPDASVLTQDNIESTIDPEARQLIFRGREIGISDDILSEELADATLISNAQARGEGMFMLASDPGTGKTFVIAASVRSIINRLKAGGNPNPKVILVTQNQTLIDQFQRDTDAFDIKDNVEFITYASLDDTDTTNPPKDTDVLVFDEAHNIRYSREGQSARSAYAEQWIKKSKFVLMSSATPYEDLSQMEFLAPTGIFKEFDKPEFYQGKNGFYGFASVFGGKVTLNPQGKPSGVQWTLTGDAALAEQSAAREYLRRRGIFSQRAARLPEGMVFFDYPLVEGEAQWNDIYNKTVKALETAKGLDDNARMYVTNLQKRILEASKAKAAVDMARKELADGRKVAIFVETKSERDYNLPEEIAKFDAYVEAGGDMSKDAREAAGIMFEGAIKFFRALVNEGVTTINFPSAQDTFRKAFKDDVVFFTGDEQGAAGEDSLGRWEAGESNVIVVTMARGGTGLSLHDKRGNDPRTQIVISLPWRPTDMVQVSQRIARYGMQTPARINWLFNNQIAFERKLSTVVGARMANMGAIVKGVSTDMAQRVSSAVTDFRITPMGDLLMADDPVQTPTDESLEVVKKDTARQLRMSIPAKKVRQLTPRDVGSVKEAMAVIARAIPFVKDIITVDTAENLLKIKDITQDERDVIQEGSEGFFNPKNGRTVVVVDNVTQLDEHGSAAAAIANTMVHEIMHRGIESIRSIPRMSDLSYDLHREMRQYVTDAEIDRLIAIGYTQFSDWRSDTKIELEAREEVYVRKLNAIIQREGVNAINRTMVRGFLDWVKAIIHFMTGRLGPKRGTDEYYLYWAKQILNASQHAPENGSGELRRAAGVASDAEYLAAVEAGDMEKAQRMVDEAAKAAGYNVGPLLHGTEKDFTEFREAAKPKKNEMFSFGFHFTDSPDLAGHYGENRITAHLRLTNPLDVEQVVTKGEGLGAWIQKVAPKTKWFPQGGKPQVYLKNALDALPAAKVKQALIEAGYDGITYNAKFEEANIGYRTLLAEGKSTIVFDPNQIKSADPVTYDDAGNVIPLSKRFQPTSPDIRQAPAEPEFSQRRLDYLETKNKEALDRLGLPTEAGTHGQQDWKAVLEKMRDDPITTNREKAVIEAMLKLDWAGLDFVVRSDGRLRNAGEWIDGDRATIAINLRAAGRGRISLNGLVLHELLHHATARKIKNPANANERALVASLNQLLERVRNYAKQTGNYGRFKYELDSLDEFVAALFPDRAHERSFVAFLDTVPDSYNPRSRASQFLRSVLNRVAELLSRLFGTGEIGKDTVLANAIQQSIALVAGDTIITKQEVDRGTAMLENLRSDPVMMSYLVQAVDRGSGFVSLADLHQATGLPFDVFMDRIRADDASGLALLEPMDSAEAISEQDRKFAIEMPDGTVAIRVAYPQTLNGVFNDRKAMDGIREAADRPESRQSPIDSGVDPENNEDSSRYDLMKDSAPVNVAEIGYAQVFGKKRGEAYHVKSVDESRAAAVRFLGLTFDANGLPVITPETTAKVKEATARILEDTARAVQSGDPSLRTSPFIDAFVKYAGKNASVPGVALQAELIRYGTMLAAKTGDMSVFNSWKGNYNNTILGHYFTLAESGRALQMRGRYSSEANTAFNLLIKNMADAAEDGGKKLGVDGKAIDEEVEGAGNDIENALPEDSPSGKTINNAKPPLEGMDVLRRVVDALSGKAQEVLATIIRETLRADAIQRRIDEMEARNAGSRQSILDEYLSDDSFDDIPENLEEAKALLENTHNKLADLHDQLSKLLEVPGVTVGGEIPTPQPPRGGGKTGGTPKPKPTTPSKPDDTIGKANDEEVDEDASEDENESEAMVAARRVKSIVERFLKKEFKATQWSPTLFSEIRDMVIAAANNDRNLTLDAVSTDLTAKLVAKGVEKEMADKLVNLAWAAYLAMPEKTAQNILARLQSTPAVAESFGSEKTKEVKRTISKFIRTPANSKLSEDEAVAKLAPELVRLGVKQATAKEVAKVAHGAAINERAKRMARIYDRVLSPGKGNYSSVIKAFKDAKDMDTSDMDWQFAVVSEFFVKNGLSKEDADLMAERAFTENKFPAIFSTAGVRETANAEQRMRKAIENLIKARVAARNRNATIVKQPDGTFKNLSASQKVRQMNIRALYRQQIIVPASFEDFEKQAAAFGATSVEARAMFDLANTERRVREMVGKSPTRLSALIAFIKENTADMTTDPSGAAGTIRNPLIRQQLIRTFLEANGFSPPQIDAAASWVDKQLVDHIVAAKEKALQSALKKQERYKQASLAGQQETATLAEKHVTRMRELIRLGMADPSLRASQALAEAMGFSAFSDADNRKLVRLDEIIQRATAEGRDTDVARALRDMFQLFELRRPEKTALQVLAISYNNNALGGLSTLAVNTVAPFGSMVNRMLIDLGSATISRDMSRVELITESFGKVISDYLNYLKFALRSDAYTNAMQQQVLQVTRLNRDFRDGMKNFRDTDLSAWKRLSGAARAITALTDITRRILSSSDQAWYATMQNYFLKSASYLTLTKNGITGPEAYALVTQTSTDSIVRMQTEQALIASMTERVKALIGRDDATVTEEFDKIVSEPDPSLDTNNESLRMLDQDIRGTLRALRVPEWGPQRRVKEALKELRTQYLSVPIRMKDLARHQLSRQVAELVSANKDTQNKIDKELQEFATKESEYETGNHRGEEAPIADVLNNFTSLVRLVGNSVLRRNPILGRVLLGYFGVPVNLLNRGAWFTPYGLIRYMLIKKFAGKKEAFGIKYDVEFYRQSAATDLQLRQRLTEAIVGSTSLAVVMLLQTMLGDDDEPIFKVTLAGPANKTERDAWIKQGHHQGSLELNIAGKRATMSWARGILEPWKMNMILAGAVDDMRLNRKLGHPLNASSMGEYLGAVMSGFHEQATFLGAKSTLGFVAGKGPDTNMLGGLLYKANPVIPFSGLISSVERLFVGPDQFRGRMGAIWSNVPIARSLLTRRDVNALGDPRGFPPGDTLATAGNRMYLTGLMPLAITTPPSPQDARIYEFIMERGTGPGLPQRGAIEARNGLLSDDQWIDYVTYRGKEVKRLVNRSFSRLKNLDDTELTRAMGEISSDATKAAKARYRLK
jgi:hypothetical protein